MSGPSSSQLRPALSPVSAIHSHTQIFVHIVMEHNHTHNVSVASLTVVLSSQADRRQSMMFTIENTPKKSSYLKKGLDKLRSSARKSPGKSSRKSPAQTSARKYQENMPSGNSRAGVGRAGRIGNFKSPQVATKGQRNSPRATSRTAKSPGLTASTRKVNTHRQIHSWFDKALFNNHL